MKTKGTAIVMFYIALGIILSGCGPGQVFGPTMTPTPTITPTPTPIGGGAGKLIFSWRKGRSDSPDEGFQTFNKDLPGERIIFTSNWDGTNVVPITQVLNGWNYVESISPDGHKALVSSFKDDRVMSKSYGDLYIINLDQINEAPLKIASHLKRDYYGQCPIAIWIDDDHIVYMGLYGGEFGLFSVGTDGSNPTRISQSNTGYTPKCFDPTNSKEYIFWDGRKTYWSLFRTSIDESKQDMYDERSFFCELSPDGTKCIIDYYSWDKIYVISLENWSPLQQIGCNESIVENAFTVDPMYYRGTWLPDNSKILFWPRATKVTYGDNPWYKKLPIYLGSLKDNSLEEIKVNIEEVLGLTNDEYGELLPPFGNIGEWSPDGQQVIFEYAIKRNPQDMRPRYATIILDITNPKNSYNLTNHIPGLGDSFVHEPMRWLPTPK